MVKEVDLDLRGLKCPQPILKIQSKSSTLSTGTIMKVFADCSTFERDLNIWAIKTGKTILECDKNEGTWVARIRL
ncbi:MAG: sulfurtransferase TusA family protein [Halobacteriota archaeon]